MTRVRSPDVIAYRHDSNLGRWEHVHREPHPRLQPYILRYRGYTEEAYHGPPRRDLPSPTAHLVLSFGHWIEARDPDRGRIDHPYAIGVTDRHALRRLEPGWNGMIVDLTPLGAWRLLRVPMSVLVNREISLTEFLGSSTLRLRSQLAGAGDWNTRFSLLERFLASRIEAAAEIPPPLVLAWSRLLTSGGALKINELASSVELSPKALNAHFRMAIGLSPKRIARLIRLDRALHLLSRPEVLPWTQIAAACGFYDQAHMINEVRNHVGLPPTELRALVRANARMSNLPLGILSGTLGDQQPGPQHSGFGT